MKANIHPQYNLATQVVCSCGNMFTVGSTKQGTIRVELCNNCHPLYTGQQKFVDRASRIEKFQAKMAAVKPIKVKKQEEKQEYTGPRTLKEMLEALKR